MIAVEPIDIAECHSRLAADPSWRQGPARLDSAPAGGKWSRWSYAPGPATLLVEADARTGIATLRDAAGTLRIWPDPLAALRWLGEKCLLPPQSGPPFKGGWVGYLSYDLGRWFETLPATATDEITAPLFRFTFHPRVLAWDAAASLAYECRLPADADDHRLPLDFPARYANRPAPPRSNFTRPAYEAAVRRAIEYVAAGDVFQVNLSQRFTAGLPDSPTAIYDHLRRRFPAWLGGLLDWGDLALLCNSPELFLRLTPDPATGLRRVLTRPIKGTRPLGPGMEDALLNSAKDGAELNMIVDLERNDLGRVCATGTVKVTEGRTVETHPTVHHGAATVEGVLRPDVTLIDLLAATFPGGSVTGAPKIRAMQIIEELERTRRGPYCGAIGYLSADGHVQFNLAIRTMIVAGDSVHIPVGGGIVADSEPTEEYEETLVKARAMFAALGVG